MGAKKRSEEKGQKEDSAQEAGNERITELENKNAELLNTLRMVQAEFENYKKRVERDRESQIRNSNRDLILEILPIMDNLEIALQSHARSSEGKEVKDEMSEFVKGIELIYSQMMDVLKKNGVRPIAALGEKFDPHFHECMMQSDSDEESGKIIEEFQKGYMMGEMVIRPSKVKISR